MATWRKYSWPVSLSRRQFIQAGALAATAALLDPAEAATPKPDIMHGSRTKPQVALTFHGAGSRTIAESLLQILRTTKTPVSIFAVGTWLISNPNYAKEIVADGHDLGNHTLHHYAMKTLTAKQVDSEIAGCAAELKKLIGNHGSWFRPSGTQHTTALIRKSALKNGYSQSISYEVDSMDYTDPGKSAIINNVMNSVQNGSIISLHFGHKDTVMALPTLLEKLHAKGLIPVTLTTMLGKI